MLQNKFFVNTLGLTINPKQKQLVFVTEYFECDSLYSLLGKQLAKLSHSDTIQIALDVAKGLQYLHSQSPKVVYNNLSCRKIFVYTIGGKKHAKISPNFYRPFEDDEFHADTVIIGGVAHLAPELFNEEKSLDEKADVYS